MPACASARDHNRVLVWDTGRGGQRLEVTQGFGSRVDRAVHVEDQLLDWAALLDPVHPLAGHVHVYLKIPQFVSVHALTY